MQLALKRALHDLPESHIRQLMLDMGHLALKMHFSEYADEHGADTIKYLQRWDARTSNADWDEGKNAESMTLEDITGHILLKVSSTCSTAGSSDYFTLCTSVCKVKQPDDSQNHMLVAAVLTNYPPSTKFILHASFS